MNNKTSVYDKENFFALYQKLRSNPISLNEIVEKPTMLSLLPDLQGKKLLDAKVRSIFRVFFVISVTDGKINGIARK